MKHYNNDSIGKNWEVSFNQRKVLLPDFQEPETMPDWWQSNLENLVEVSLNGNGPDGFILLHNSPKVDSEDNSNCDLKPVKFAPGGTTILGNQTVCPTAMHFDNETFHFHVHNHYGLGHVNLTRNYNANCPVISMTSSPGISIFGGGILSG